MTRGLQEEVARNDGVISRHKRLMLAGKSHELSRSWNGWPLKLPMTRSPSAPRNPWIKAGLVARKLPARGLNATASSHPDNITIQPLHLYRRRTSSHLFLFPNTRASLQFSLQHVSYRRDHSRPQGRRNTHLPRRATKLA